MILGQLWLAAVGKQQVGFNISEVLWYSSDGSFTGIGQDTHLSNEIANSNLMRMNTAVKLCINWTNLPTYRIPFQYPISRIIAKSREVSKLWDWYFDLPHRFEIKFQRHIGTTAAESEESEIVCRIDQHRIHLQIKLHSTITHKHVNRSWYMESPQRHRRSKVANPTAPSSPVAPPAVIKQLRAPVVSSMVCSAVTISEMLIYLLFYCCYLLLMVICCLCHYYCYGRSCLMNYD